MLPKISIFALASTIAFTSGCSEYGPSRYVQVDGYTVRIVESEASPGSWVASQRSLNPDLVVSDGNRYLRNQRAIEIASGCTIIPETISQGNWGTEATVSC